AATALGSFAASIPDGPNAAELSAAIKHAATALGSSGAASIPDGSNLAIYTATAYNIFAIFEWPASVRAICRSPDWIYDQPRTSARCSWRSMRHDGCRIPQEGTIRRQ